MNQEQYNAMITENQIAQENYANMKAEIDRINQVAALYQQATPEKQNALRGQMTQLLDRYTQLRAGLNDASNRLAQSQANINAYNNEIARQQGVSNIGQRRRTTNPNPNPTPNPQWTPEGVRREVSNIWSGVKQGVKNFWDSQKGKPIQKTDYEVARDYYNDLVNNGMPKSSLGNTGNDRRINVVTRNVGAPNQYTVDNYLSGNNSNINTGTNEKYPVSDAYKNASWINQQVNPKFRTDRNNAYKNRWGL